MQCEVTGFESKAYQAVSRMYASATLALSLRFHSIPLIVYDSTDMSANTFADGAKEQLTTVFGREIFRQRRRNA